MNTSSPAVSAQPGRLTYVPALDGMRGISLPGTIYTHFMIFLGFLPTAPSWIHHAGPFTLNIEMFFVLSGALITSLLMVEYQRTETLALRKFYLRRSRRLGPALIAVVPLLLVSQFLLPGSSSTPLGHHPWVTALFVLLFVGNWQLATGGNIGWLGPAWTLGIEEQFYLTWPTLLRATLRRGWRRQHVVMSFWILIVLFSAVGGVLARRLDPARTFYMTPTQISPILLGCALGYVMTTNAGGWFVRMLRYRATAAVGLAGMVLISAELWDHYTFLMGGGYALYGAAACLLIGHCLATADQPSWVSRVLGWRPFVVIGQVSYEAYLVHCIVILAVLRVAPRMPVADMIVLDVGLIAVISGAFYYFIEQPIRRYGWLAAFRRRERPVRPVPATVRPARSLGGMLVGVASATAVVVAAVVLVATAKSTPPLGGGARPGTPVAQGEQLHHLDTGGIDLPGAADTGGGAALAGSGGRAAGGPSGGGGAPSPVRDAQPRGSGTGAVKAPEITSIAPPTGSVLGGNAITIRGRHFGRDAKVYFDALLLHQVTRLDSRTLRVVVPAAHAVEVERPLAELHGLMASVRVVTAGGRSALGAAALYTYV